MSDKKENKGWDLFSILFLIFLTLKLGGWGIVATWSWWWVFSPIWLPIAIAFVALGIIAFIERL
jgi:hypothetical protein